MYEMILVLTVVSERLTELFMNAFFSDNTKEQRALIAYSITTIICAVFAIPLKLNLFALVDIEKGLVVSLLTASIMGLGTQWVHYFIDTFSSAVNGKVTILKAVEETKDGGIPKTTLTDFLGYEPEEVIPPEDGPPFADCIPPEETGTSGSGHPNKVEG